MSKFLTEPFNGGIVTAREPVNLQPGELTDALNCCYYPYSDLLCRAPGQTVISDDITGSTRTINGMVQARFEDGANYLLAEVTGSGPSNGKILYSDITNGIDSFAELITGRTSAYTDTSVLGTLNSVQYDNRHYLFNGVDLNRVVLKDLTTREHGLKPVTGPLTLIGTTGSTFTATVTGYYQYWATEILKFSDGQELESTVSTLIPLKVLVSSTTAAPDIKLPTPANRQSSGSTPIAVGFRIYRSEAMATINESLFPVGKRMVDISTTDKAGAAIPDLHWVDSRSLATSLTVAAGSNDVMCYYLETGAGGTAPVTSFVPGGSTIAGEVAAAGGNAVRFTRGVTRSGGNALPPPNAFTLFNFPFTSAITGNISGIEVVIKAKSLSANIVTLGVTLGHRLAANRLNAITAPGIILRPGFTSISPVGITGETNDQWQIGMYDNRAIAKTATVLATGTYDPLTFGSSTNPWLPSSLKWLASDFITDFSVQIQLQWGLGGLVTDWVEIDQVSLVIHYLGVADQVTDFKIYDYVQVDEVTYGANGRPPVASVGTVYEGSLVTDSKDAPRRLNWSVPGKPDYFPTDVYWLDLPVHTNDRITCIETINNRLVVGTSGSLWRINYLPNEDDASFARGRAIEEISTRRGPLHSKAFCKWTTNEGREELAFIDNNGVFSTDGYSIRSILDDLKWTTIGNAPSVAGIAPVSTKAIGLLNDPATSTLRIVIGAGSICWIGSYAARHQKNGQPKWTRVAITVPAGRLVRSAAMLRTNGGAWFVVYGTNGVGGATGGQLSREDSTDTALYTDNGVHMTVTTRDIYPDGESGDAQLVGLTLSGRQLFAGITTNPASLGGTISIIELHEGAAETSVAGPITISTAGGCTLAEIGASANARGFRYGITLTDTGMNQLNTLTQEFNSFSPGGHSA